MQLQTIKDYCEKRAGGVKQLAKDAGMSEANLHRCIRLNQIQAGDLEKIARLLNVSVSIFFDEAANVGVTLKAASVLPDADKRFYQEHIAQLNDQIRELMDKNTRLEDELLDLLHDRFGKGKDVG